VKKNDFCTVYEQSDIIPGVLENKCAKKLPKRYIFSTALSQISDSKHDTAW